jgi:hypothetical protein
MPKRKPPPKPKAHRAELVATPAPGSFTEYELGLTDTEKRVDEIVQKMLSGAWLSGVSERALAKAWNVAPGTVRKLAVEASRAVKRYIRTDKDAQEEARAQVIQTFEVIRAKAMAKGDPQSLRVALDATRALGFYMGVEPAKKLDVTQRDTAFMDGWTPEEKLAYSQGGESARRQIRSAAHNGVLPGGNGRDGGEGMH